VRWQQDRLRDVAFTLSLQQTRRLTCNRRYIDANAMASLSSTLFAEFFGSDVRYVNTPEGAKEYHDHLTDRLHDDRRRVVPWLDSIRPLKG